MTQKERTLLHIDLSERIPYDTVLQVKGLVTSKEGLNTNGVSRIILCSEYLKRVKHCRIAWLNNYYKSIVDVEKTKRLFKEQYQELTNSEWFNAHYEDKSLGEIIEEE